MPGEPKAPIYKSGHWEIDLARRELRSRGVAAPLGGRAFEILEVLVQAAGELVNKYDLIRRVWPGATVGENTLHVHISAVRKAFGSDRELLKSVSGRGYRLLGTWSIQRGNSGLGSDLETATEQLPERSRLTSRRTTNLPQPVSELIGRDAELREILNLSSTQRLVTLTGTGGIGKTRLALEAARREIPRFADGVWVAELAPLTDPGLVPVTVATALGLELAAGTASPQSIATALGSRQIMLVLDNCEHVVEAAAQIADLLLRANPAMHVIATSRELLRTEGEWAYRVPPLAFPLENSSDGEDQQRYGAVRLFNDRVRSAATSFSPDVRTAASIAVICRRLEGIPLAIELAAARAATLGIESVASGLDDLFRLLTGGRRTALPRHQTLRETLNWSYGLLTETERIVLRRLAIFAGGFSLPAAATVAADNEFSSMDIVDCVANLVAKSLVVIEPGGASSRYRLLETTRAYALERLAQAGEVDTVAARHARHYLQLLSENAESSRPQSIDTAAANQGAEIDNVRAALGWAFSSTGDVPIGVALTAAAVPMWMHLSLLKECRRRVERALAAAAAGLPEDPRSEMKLQIGLAASLMRTGGANSEVASAATKALEIAERLGDVEYQLRALWRLWIYSSTIGQHRNALSLAEKSHALAATRPDLPDYDSSRQLIGMSQYALGNLPEARRHLQSTIVDNLAITGNRQAPRFDGERRDIARSHLARTLWLQGLPDQALQIAERSIAEARTINHIVSLGDVLIFAACPIALWVGDLAAAERHAQVLLDVATKHALTQWRPLGRCYWALVVVQRGQVGEGLELLRAAFADPAGGQYITHAFAHRLAESLGLMGQVAEGLGVIEEAIDRSKLFDDRWATAEQVRVKGELLLSLRDAKAAEDQFLQAIDLAQGQGALSWELRAATSLARAWRAKSQKTAARELLSPIYERFTEGFATTDLRVARALIEELS